MEKPTWNEEMQNGDDSCNMEFILSFVFTHPFMQEAEAWNTRPVSLKKKLKHPYASSKPTVFHGLWPTWECETCGALAAKLNCRRATAYARAQEFLPLAERGVATTHPDFVPLKVLRPSVGTLRLSKTVLVLLRQMIATPEYWGEDETRKFLRECAVDPADVAVLDTLIADKQEEDLDD
jgi:hypothetical protein